VTSIWRKLLGGNYWLQKGMQGSKTTQRREDEIKSERRADFIAEVGLFVGPDRICSSDGRG
jgi:hypothetical protein